MIVRLLLHLARMAAVGCLLAFAWRGDKLAVYILLAALAVGMETLYWSSFSPVPGKHQRD